MRTRSSFIVFLKAAFNLLIPEAALSASEELIGEVATLHSVQTIQFNSNQRNVEEVNQLLIVKPEKCQGRILFQLRQSVKPAEPDQRSSWLLLRQITFKIIYYWVFGLPS